MLFCPKCATEAVPGQRFCRSCGTNLGLILDAMEGKQRGTIDFETLKNDLKELGTNLRAGFEQASAGFKNTKRLDQRPPMPPGVQAGNIPPQQIAMADMARDLKNSIKKEISKGLNKVRMASSRKYSLQKATLSIFSGGAWMLVWYRLLDEAFGSGLLGSLEALILQKTNWEIVGLVPIFRLFWLLGLVPVASGVAHLINGIFFAPKLEQIEPEEPAVQQPVYYYPQNVTSAYATPTYGVPVSAVPPASHIAASTTNELNEKIGSVPQQSVTEDPTMRFGVKETQ